MERNYVGNCCNEYQLLATRSYTMREATLEPGKCL